MALTWFTDALIGHVFSHVVSLTCAKKLQYRTEHSRIMYMRELVPVEKLLSGAASSVPSIMGWVMETSEHAQAFTVKFNQNFATDMEKCKGKNQLDMTENCNSIWS